MNRKDRRLAAKKKNKSVAVDYVASPGEWRAYHEPPPPPEPKVPGFNCPPVNEEFTAKVNRNSWHDSNEFDEVVATIKKLSTKDNYDWYWAYNTDCKYVDIRIDMRDGGFILQNRQGERINLEQLNWQYKSPEKK